MVVHGYSNLTCFNIHVIRSRTFKHEAPLETGHNNIVSKTLHKWNNKFCFKNNETN